MEDSHLSIRIYRSTEGGLHQCSRRGNSDHLGMGSERHHVAATFLHTATNTHTRTKREKRFMIGCYRLGGDEGYTSLLLVGMLDLGEGGHMTAKSTNLSVLVILILRCIVCCFGQRWDYFQCTVLKSLNLNHQKF